MLQIKDEVKGVLEFINYVYEIFGFKYELELSTVFTLFVYIFFIISKSFYDLWLKIAMLIQQTILGLSTAPHKPFFLCGFICVLTTVLCDYKACYNVLPFEHPLTFFIVLMISGFSYYNLGEIYSYVIDLLFFSLNLFVCHRFVMSLDMVHLSQSSFQHSMFLGFWRFWIYQFIAI